MKHAQIYCWMLLLVLAIDDTVFANEPDSVYLVSYATLHDKGRSGLRFAWSADGQHWNLTGNGNVYVKCDFGNQKYINSPYLFQDVSGVWHCLWSLNDTVNQFAHVASTDLVTWGGQVYPFLKQSQPFRRPVVQYDKSTRKYTIAFLSGDRFFTINTSDFKTFDEAVAIPASEYNDDRVAIKLPGAAAVTGNVCKVAWPVVARLTEAWQVKMYKDRQAKESFLQDSIRFAGLKPLMATITLQPENRKPISDLLIGVFFEDINYSADGGLYAELLQNRDFEYETRETLYRDSSWNSSHSWTISGQYLGFTIDSTAPLHPNNPRYAVLDAKEPGGALINNGYDGIPLKKGDRYAFSLFAKNYDGNSKRLLVKLVTRDGNVLAQAALHIDSRKWKKYSAILIAGDNGKNARLELQPLSAGRVMLDVVSLFPEKTFKNRKNGLRADLAETIAAIRPRFVRFPGGCVTHGDGVENMYRWKNTIGPIETRKPQPNIWRYHQSVGLGYFEYFQFCDDIGAEPLPVIAAGVPCQNSGSLTGACGQYGGIPIGEMNKYVQDVLDLVEWANGPVHSKWGKLRAEAGHPAPFNLKYIGIGNEDLISDVFEARFTMIYKAIRQKHPEITVIGTAGPFHEGTDYRQGWALATRLQVPLVDEHYYEEPGWFINNQDYYDHYDRKKSKVYLGEYASRGNTLYNALAEALYLTGVERNGDVVRMTSYAPLLAKEKHTQWNPDLIYFNNTEVKPTVNYEVQKLFGNNAGNEYLPSVLKLSNEDDAVKKRLAISVVRDTTDGAVVVKLVNGLPVAASVQIDLGNLAAGAKADKTVIKGQPNDKALPVTVTTSSIGNVLEDTLPPYSFTVWKIHK
jgi:alpha-L-arabinofuranosidase